MRWSIVARHKHVLQENAIVCWAYAGRSTRGSILRATKRRAAGPSQRRFGRLSSESRPLRGVHEWLPRCALPRRSNSAAMGCRRGSRHRHLKHHVCLGGRTIERKERPGSVSRAAESPRSPGVNFLCSCVMVRVHSIARAHLFTKLENLSKPPQPPGPRR